MRVGTNLLVAVMLVPNVSRAQSFLEKFSYEGLRPSGVGIELGPVWSNRLTTELSGGVRLDYGLIAPRVRVMFGGSYFKGDLRSSEVEEFARRLQGVVVDPTGDAVIDVGQIAWANIEGTADLQYLFPLSPMSLAYLGLGLGVHFRNGSGAAIEDTFVEDALDTVTAGAAISFGGEVAVTSRFHLTAEARGELTSELRMGSLRAGVMYRIRPRELP